MDDIEQQIEKLGNRENYSGSTEENSNGLDLEVKGIGKIKFPISAKQSKSLIKIAQPAPFGYKDKTIVDLNIRNVWEI